MVDLAERVFGVDWDAVRAAVTRRLSPTRPVTADLMDPRRDPSYWWVPVLVGDYVHADEESVTEDLERYVSGCLVRHFYHDVPQPFSLLRDDELARLIRSAYDACANRGGTFDERFAVKCQTWTVLLAFGTQAIRRRSKAGEYRAALSAIVAVYSCAQLLDDWHDQADDLAREHWNLWIHEPVDSVLSIIELLLRDAAHRVSQLRRHMLRDALAAQLRDTTEELADLVALMQRPSASRPRSGVESGVRFLTEHLSKDAPGLWCDFSLSGVSAGSTEWISALIATLLAPIPFGRSIARAVASTLLAHDRPSGGPPASAPWGCTPTPPTPQPASANPLWESDRDVSSAPKRHPQVRLGVPTTTLISPAFAGWHRLPVPTGACVGGLANPVLEPNLRSMCQLRRGLADLDDLDAASEPPAGAMLDNAGMHGGQRRDHGGQRRDAWWTTLDAGASISRSTRSIAGRRPRRANPHGA
jgi:hypothetical protein